MILKPCPFCGSDAILVKVVVGEDKEYPYRVECLNLGCNCRTDRFLYHESAIRAWNMRVGEEDEN